MIDISQNLLAVVVVLLFILGLLLWIQGRFAVAGLSFLTASLVIYYRETRA